MAEKDHTAEKLNTRVTLNVGGTLFETTLLTLVKHSGTMLANMFSGQFDTCKDQNGHYFIDADGQDFRYILRYLQNASLPPADKVEEVYRTAEFFGVEGLLQKLEEFPCISLKKIREGFLSKLPEMSQHIRKILNFINNLRGKDRLTAWMSSPTDPVSFYVCVRSALTYDPPEPEHACARGITVIVGRGVQEARAELVDVELGPEGVNCSSREYMNCVRDVMKADDYNVRIVGLVTERVGCVDSINRAESCGGDVFHMLLDWLNVPHLR